MVLEAKILEAKYEAKLEFLGGGGCKTNKPSVGGVLVFSGTARKTDCVTMYFQLLISQHTITRYIE